MADILEDAAVKLDSFLGNMGYTADTYLQLEKIIPAVTDLIGDQAKELRVLNKELGNGSKLTAQLRGDFAKLSKQIGVSTQDILELTSTTKNYHQGITGLTASTLKFIKASGASSDILGDMTAKMNILGNVSSESLEEMYEDLLAVRDAYGLTVEQLNGVIQSLDKYAVTTQASNEQIRQASVLMAEFTSRLTAVGMAADSVKNMLDSMIDPDKMMNNVVLMSKIGITVNDMVSGDPVAKLEGATEKLKQLGQEITNIAQTNRYQANEVAKVYNLTLEEATMLAELDTSDRALNTQKNLEQYRNEMATFADGLAALKNTIGGAISGPLAYVGEVLEKFGNTIGLIPKGLTALLGIWLGKKLINKLREGLASVMGEAAKKFSSSISEGMSKYLGEVDARMKTKTADIAGEKEGIKNRNKEKPEKLGFGYNYKAKQERIFNERNIQQKVTGPAQDYEQLLKYRDSLNEKKKKAEDTSLPKAERDYYIKMTKGFDDIIKKIDAIEASGVGVTQKFGEEGGEVEKAKKSWQNAKDKDKDKAAGTFMSNSFQDLGLEQFNKGGELHDKLFKPGEGREKISEVLAAASGDGKTSVQALNSLIDFFKNSDLDYADDAIKVLNTRLNELVEDSETNAKQLNEIHKTTRLAARADEGVNKKASPLALVQGAGVGIANTFNNLVGGIKEIPGKIGGFFNALPGKIFGGLGKMAKMAGISILAILGKKVLEALSKNEEFQKAMESITGAIGGVFDVLVAALEPLFQPLADLVTGLLKLIQPLLDAITWLLSKVAKFLGGAINKITSGISSITNSVSTIEESYKEEDLRTMVGAQGQYNAATDNVEIIGLLKDITHQMDGVRSNQKENTDMLVATALAN